MSKDDERPPRLLQPFTMSMQMRFQQPAAHPQWQFQTPAAPSISARFQQALALHQQGRLNEAEQVCREVLQHAPVHSDALHLLGVLTLQTLRPANGLRDLRRLDAALRSFDRSIALKPDFAEAHNYRGIVLQDLARLDDALASFEAAIALKPDYAEAHNNRGVVLQKLKRVVDAAASFETAISLKHDSAVAYNNRGNLAKDLRNLASAVADFDRAIALRPAYAAAHYNRGIALHELRRFDDALTSFDTAIALQPDYAEAYNNRGLLLQELKRPEDAIASFERTIALTPNCAEAYSNQSMCLLQTGQLERGWRLYEWRKKLEQPIGNRSFAKPLWLGKDDISNRTLFAHWEQGLGDTIQFSRFGELLKARGTKVVMSVQEPLYRLFKQMSPGIQIIHEHDVPTAFDYHCPLMSLPLALGTTLDTIPARQAYLFADESLRNAWRSRLPPKTKPRIGIVWCGSTTHKNDRHRSIDLPALAPLFSANVHWISLQKELKEGDIALLARTDHVVSRSEELTDFSETAAIVDLLDLVISVDTSVAHLAGAMGKPVWILLPYNSDWRWFLDRGDSPWYPTARLFRQDSTRSWGGVIAHVRGALDEFVRSLS
jgi:tetratricopeptide (TPR) repeat protein